MVIALLALTLAAAPAAPIKVASTPFTPVGGLASDLAEFYGETFATRLGEQPGFQVTTPRALGAMMGLERQKQLMGCAEAATSCLTELANALGVDALVIGEAAKLDESTQVNVRVIQASDGQTLFSLSRRAKTSEQVLDALDDAARNAADQLRKRLGRAAVGSPPPGVSTVAGPPVRWQPWAVVGAGAVAAGVGAYLLVSAPGVVAPLKDKVPDAAFPPAEGFTLADQASSRATVGVVLVGVGVAALAGGVAWAVLGADAPATPTAWIGPDGAGVGVTLALP